MPEKINEQKIDLAAKYGLPEKTRWVDFSAYDMSLKLCVFKDGKALVMERGDAHPEIVEALGFVKIGNDWIREDFSYEPRQFMAVAPEAVVTRDMPINDMLIERDEYFSSILPGTPMDARKRAFSARVSSAAAKGKDEADISSILGMPETCRWMDFSAYGMYMKCCVYADAKVLVMEGGDEHPELVAALGFVKTGDDWVKEKFEFRPIEFRAIASEAVLDRYKPTREVIIDRRDRFQPQTHWFASFEVGGNNIQAFGATPEGAVKSLVEAWLDHAKTEQVDPALIVELRDGISVVPFVSGKGYAKGLGDTKWYQGGLSGDDERFDDILPVLTRNQDITPGYR
jgi:hypothetical protein